jgi:hypothetical protein
MSRYPAFSAAAGDNDGQWTIIPTPTAPRITIPSDLAEVICVRSSLAAIDMLT